MVPVGIYCLIVGELLTLTVSIVSIVQWYRHNGEKMVVGLLSIVHFSLLALLTCNFSNYNSYFIMEHRLFWKRYKLLLKISLAFLVFYGVGGILLCFGVTAHSNYLFFAGVEIVILTLIVLVLQILWVWLPLKEPEEQQVISEKSTEILMDSEVDKHSDAQEEEEKKKHRLRMSEIKTEGEPVRKDKQLPKVKSNYEFNTIGEVVKLAPEDIAGGIEKGMFRKSEE